jgi:hypothetical protein
MRRASDAPDQPGGHRPVVNDRSSPAESNETLPAQAAITRVDAPSLAAKDNFPDLQSVIHTAAGVRQQEICGRIQLEQHLQDEPAYLFAIPSPVVGCGALAAAESSGMIQAGGFGG